MVTAGKMQTERGALEDPLCQRLLLLTPFLVGRQPGEQWFGTLPVPTHGRRCLDQLLPAGEGQPTSPKAKPCFPPTPDPCRDYLRGLFLGWLPPTPNSPVPQGGDPRGGGDPVTRGRTPSPAWG